MIGRTGDDRPRPPRVPAFLRLALPPAHRDHIVGDLIEGFSARASRGARHHARLWFWTALGSTIVASLLTRLRYHVRDVAGSSTDPDVSRASRRHRAIAGLGDDIRFAVRILAKNPGLAVGAVVMLALGIGVNSVMFTMNLGMSRVVERLEAPDELVFVSGVAPGWYRAPVSAREFLAWQAQADAFEDMAAYRPVMRYISGNGEPQRIRTVFASTNLLPLLGLDAEVGRLHGAADERDPAATGAIITHRLWQDRYGGGADVLGRTIRLDDLEYTIVGVLPVEAELDVLWGDAAVFLPLALTPTDVGREDRTYRVVGRLAHEASVEQAQTQLTTITGQLAEDDAPTNSDVAVLAVPFADLFYSFDDRLAVGSLIAAALAVLLIACVNLANVLLAKGSARQGEVAIRLALGASRFRVVRQLLTESLLLACVAGALGIALSVWGMRLVHASFPVAPFLPHEVSLDPTVVFHAIAIAVAAALTFGLTPALLATRASLSESMKAGSRKLAAPSHTRFRRGILAAQLALTVPLALSCVMAFRHVQTLGNLDFGFTTDQLLVAEVNLPEYRFEERAARSRFFSAVVESVGSLPGVSTAAAGMNVPIGAGYTSVIGPLVVEGREGEDGSNRGPRGYEVVSPEFFRTLGVRLQRGRFMTQADGPGDPIAAVVNEAMVRRYWPDQNPIGRRLIPDMAAGGWDADDATREVSVVGVVADFGATFFGDPPRPALYVSHRQWPTSTMKLVARTSVDPLSLVPALRAAVGRLDSGVPVSQIHAGDDLVDIWLQESRTVAAIVGVIGFLALGMAVIGLYGMVAYSVAQRTFELGLRMVLGADRGAIRRSVMRSHVSLAAVGIAVGLFISAVGALIVRSQLVMLRIPYVSTVGALVLLLAVVVLIASYVPARRATRIEPVEALRCE